MSQNQINSLMISVLFFLVGMCITKGCRHDAAIRKLQEFPATSAATNQKGGG